MTDGMTIGPGTRINLHFRLSLDDGSEVDSTFDKTPASFVFGDGSLLPGVEKQLVGLSAGQTGSFRIEPEDAFGQPNPSNVQQFSRGEFCLDVPLEPGLVLSFADAKQQELPGVVSKVEGEWVTIDFNHPLAGRTLIFDVEIIAVMAEGAST